MDKVIIIPTTETSWGIEDKYNIKSNDNTVFLYKDVPQKLLKCIIEGNNYQVISGSKYM